MRFALLVGLAACGASPAPATHHPAPAVAPMPAASTPIGAPLLYEMDGSVVVYGTQFAPSPRPPQLVAGSALEVVYLDCYHKLDDAGAPAKVSVSAERRLDVESCAAGRPAQFDDVRESPAYRWAAATFRLREASASATKAAAATLPRGKPDPARVLVVNAMYTRIIRGRTGCEGVPHPCDPGPREPDRYDSQQEQVIFVAGTPVELPFTDDGLAPLVARLGSGQRVMRLPRIELANTPHDRYTRPGDAATAATQQQYLASARDPDPAIQLALELDAVVWAVHLHDKAAFDAAFLRLRADMPATPPAKVAPALAAVMPTFDAIASGDARLAAPAVLAGYVTVGGW